MYLDDFTLGIVGTLAGILILSGWVPQIIKGYKTKRLNDVSSYLMICGTHPDRIRIPARIPTMPKVKSSRYMSV